MIAVIETGGKQYTVQVGDVITVETLPNESEEVVFGHVLLTSENGKTEIGTPFLDTAVQGKIVKEGRGEKIRVYKMHAKKRYQRTQGHRQNFMKVEITGIGGKGAPKVAPTKKAEVAEKPAAVKKETAAKKPAKAAAPKKAAAPTTKKAAPKKTAAAKKPAAKKAK